MHEVTVRNRSDGVTEVAPSIAPLSREERALVIVTVVLAAGGFFVSGWIPAPVLGVLLAACLAGEIVLAAKALFLALRRPLAEVHEVRSLGRPRHRRPR